MFLSLGRGRTLAVWGALGLNQIYPVFRRWTTVLWVWNDMGWVIKDRIFVFGWTNPFIKTWSGQSVWIIFAPNFVFILLADHFMIIFLNIICQLILLSWITFYSFILGKMTLVFLTIDGKKSHRSTLDELNIEKSWFQIHKSFEDIDKTGEILAGLFDSGSVRGVVFISVFLWICFSSICYMFWAVCWGQGHAKHGALLAMYSLSNSKSNFFFFFF